MCFDTASWIVLFNVTYTCHLPNDVQLWPFTSYNWIYLWDKKTFYKWGFLSTYNRYNLGLNCNHKLSIDRRISAFLTLDGSPTLFSQW